MIFEENWNLAGKSITLRRQRLDPFKEVDWCVQIHGEYFNQTRLFKSRNAAMNFIRSLIKKLDK